MKITKSQLKDIIKEELEGVVGPSPTTSARLLKERKDRIRIHLDETYSPAALDDLAGLLAEQEASQAWERGEEEEDEDLVTGAKRIFAGAGDVQWKDIEMKDFKGSIGDKMITTGEVFLWGVDVWPKFFERATKTPEAKAGLFIKLARVVSRATGGILFLAAGKALMTLGKMVNETWPPEKQEQIAAGLSDEKPKQIGAPQLGAGSPAPRAGIAERKRSLKRRR